MTNPFRKLIHSVAKDGATGVADYHFSRRHQALRQELQKRATLEAADMVQNEMSTAMYCDSQFSHLTFAAGERPAGLILEFGVYKGGTINHLAGIIPDETIYGFDSFEGLPEAWIGNRYSPRNFNRQGNAPKVKDNVTLVQGRFDETLPPFMDAHDGPVGFMNVDCDIYSSTDTALRGTEGRLADGCVIVFDEYFNYHGWKLHEFKAFQEFIQRTGYRFEYIGYSGAQVSVKVFTSDG